MADIIAIKWDDNKSIYKIDEASATVTYVCQASGTGKILIRKYTSPTSPATETIITQAYDTWSNRLTATYQAIDVSEFSV